MSPFPKCRTKKYYKKLFLLYLLGLKIRFKARNVVSVTDSGDSCGRCG